MSPKLLFVGLFVGSTVGSIVASFFGADTFSITSGFFAFVGGAIGIWIAYRFINN